ncbi:hypothetical protein BDZ97DRAFT_719055 [Flammula alnicola]|nr:hypothetical protein BDZ97DRAFT_719055 [Flammula alnicola]
MALRTQPTLHRCRIREYREIVLEIVNQQKEQVDWFTPPLKEIIKMPLARLTHSTHTRLTTLNKCGIMRIVYGFKPSWYHEREPVTFFTLESRFVVRLFSGWLRTMRLEFLYPLLTRKRKQVSQLKAVKWCMASDIGMSSRAFSTCRKPVQGITIGPENVFRKPAY